MQTSKQIINTLVILITSNRLTYLQFNEYTKLARRKTGLKPLTKGKRLPKLLTEEEIARFFNYLEKDLSTPKSFRDMILMRMLAYTGLRVSELTSLNRNDVDLGECKIFVDQGKGSKDRYVLFPQSFKVILQAYLQTIPYNNYLFESNQKRRISVRRIQQLVKQYQQEAMIETDMHPHLFRHQLLTYLTKGGLSDAQIQLISGHASKQSLEVYQHLGLKDVKGDYQKVMRKKEEEE